MTVGISKPALNLRTLLARVESLKPAARRSTFWTSGNGATTAFALQRGWKPLDVFVNGALMRPGSGEDYTVAFNGFLYTVTFAVAPSAVDIAFMAESEV